MTLESMSVILAAGLSLIACDASGGGEGGGGAGGGGAGGAGGVNGECPPDEPSFYDLDECTQKGLVCNYVRSDGCPTVKECDLEGGSGWSFYSAPGEGDACEEPGKECFYGSPDCGGYNKTATCGQDSRWHVTSEEDGCI